MSMLDLFTDNTDQLTGALRENEGYVKRYLVDYSDFYFIIRPSVSPCEGERVCLFREGVVNERLRGDRVPFDRWITNEQRGTRSLDRIECDMWQIVIDNYVKRQKRYG